MPSLATTVDGLSFRNPFLIASGPPGANANVIARAYEEGWGGVVSKTAVLDAEKIVNVQPRYARLRSRSNGEIYGWSNIELISDRPFTTWLEDFRRLKDRYPDRVLIASIMEEYHRDAWHEIVERVQETGVDGLELNMSCPHGLPERNMGSAMGENPHILREVCSWVMEVARCPVWVKLTPNVTRIEAPAESALAAGCQGLSAVNTIRSILGVDLKTLRPEPTVDGYTTPGGYSGPAILPIALRMNMEVAALIHRDYPGRTLSGIGGIETGADAAQFLLMGASTAQVCTGVMKHGYRIVRSMTDELIRFMEEHGFETIEDFRGLSLQYVTSHSDLVARQATARASKTHGVASGPHADAQWSGAEFVEQSDALSRG